PRLRLHVYEPELVKPRASRFVNCTCSAWYVELLRLPCRVTELNCGLSTIKFSGNNPLFRTKPPPWPVTFVLRLRKSARAPTLPLAMNARVFVLARSEADPVAVVPLITPDPRLIPLSIPSKSLALP